MKYLLVHGLGLAGNIWSRFVPFLNGESILVDLPGHGASSLTDYSWKGIWGGVMAAHPQESWSNTVVVLHSFSACLLPEIVVSGVKPAKVIVLEGIMHSSDAVWTNEIVALGDLDFESWLERFRSVSRMALKSQLVSKSSKFEIDFWSNSFRVVKGSALRIMACNMKKRLISSDITEVMGALNFPLLYIRGGRGRLSEAGHAFLLENRVPVVDISACGHFPMIDSPLFLSKYINTNAIGLNVAV